MEIKYFFYFLIGGLIVSTVTYFASQAKGLLAAFIANLPVITLITFLTIYSESGQNAVISYAEGLLIILFPWLAGKDVRHVREGDTVLVTNGVYRTGVVERNGMNRIALVGLVIVRSVNVLEFTVIQGEQDPLASVGDRAIRCVYLTNDSVLTGFTLTNGATRGIYGDVLKEQSGGGVWCESVTALVSNCTLSGNWSLATGGAAYSGTLNNCTLSGNVTRSVPGAASESTLNGCLVTNNFGGGVGHCNLAKMHTIENDHPEQEGN